MVMCKNMERENSHLCQHTCPVHAHKHTHTCSRREDIDITTLCTTSAQPLVCEISLSSPRGEN